MKDTREQAVELLKEWVTENLEKRAVLLTAIDVETGACTNTLMGSIGNAFVGISLGTKNAIPVRKAYKAIGLSLLDADNEMQDFIMSALGKKNTIIKDKKTS